jgi:hypothetical protein
MTDTPITLYSIGHSNVPTARLIALLEQHAIATLCDVRSRPYSRYNPQFNREALADSMQAAGIVYRYFGDTLLWPDRRVGQLQARAWRADRARHACASRVYVRRGRLPHLPPPQADHPRAA